jgi:hypothetical protein
MRRGTTTQRAVSRLVVVGFVVGLAGGLAGCTDYPEPSHLPTPTEAVTLSPTPTPTATPTPDSASVPPERPSAMDVADSAGAEAVAVYFLELYAYVYATNDLAEWRDLSHPECIFCDSVIGNVEQQASDERRSDGGLPEIESVTSTEVTTGLFNVTITATQGSSNVYGPGGELVDHAEGNRSSLIFVILSSEAGWSVREVQVDPAPSA